MNVGGCEDSLVKAVVLFNDNLKVMSQYKRHSLSTYTEFDFKVSQEVAKVNVEELSPLSDHDVVRMPVTNPQHICRHAVTSTRQRECFSSLLQSEQGVCV